MRTGTREGLLDREGEAGKRIRREEIGTVAGQQKEQALGSGDFLPPFYSKQCACISNLREVLCENIPLIQKMSSQVLFIW